MAKLEGIEVSDERGVKLINFLNMVNQIGEKLWSLIFPHIDFMRFNHKFDTAG